MSKLVYGMVASVVLSGCDLFVTPPVLCGSHTIKLTQGSSPIRPGLPCAFPDPLPFTVAHAPKVDASLAGAQSDLALVGARVFVAQAYGSVLLCPGVGDACQQGATSITAVIGRNGQLAYQGTVSFDSLGVTLYPGGTYSSSGTLLTESYSAGNSCPVLYTFDLSCVAPEE